MQQPLPNNQLVQQRTVHVVQSPLQQQQHQPQQQPAHLHGQFQVADQQQQQLQQRPQLHFIGAQTQPFSDEVQTLSLPGSVQEITLGSTHGDLQQRTLIRFRAGMNVQQPTSITGTEISNSQAVVGMSQGTVGASTSVLHPSQSLGLQLQQQQSPQQQLQPQIQSPQQLHQQQPQQPQIQQQILPQQFQQQFQQFRHQLIQQQPQQQQPQLQQIHQISQLPQIPHSHIQMPQTQLQPQRMVQTRPAMQPQAPRPPPVISATANVVTANVSWRNPAPLAASSQSSTAVQQQHHVIQQSPVQTAGMKIQSGSNVVRSVTATIVNPEATSVATNQKPQSKPNSQFQSGFLEFITSSHSVSPCVSLDTTNKYVNRKNAPKKQSKKAAAAAAAAAAVVSQAAAETTNVVADVSALPTTSTTPPRVSASSSSGTGTQVLLQQVQADPENQIVYVIPNRLPPGTKYTFVPGGAGQFIRQPNAHEVVTTQTEAMVHAVSQHQVQHVQESNSQLQQLQAQQFSQYQPQLQQQLQQQPRPATAGQQAPPQVGIAAIIQQGSETVPTSVPRFQVTNQNARPVKSPRGVTFTQIRTGEPGGQLVQQLQSNVLQPQQLSPRQIQSHVFTHNSGVVQPGQPAMKPVAGGNVLQIHPATSTFAHLQKGFTVLTDPIANDSSVVSSTSSQMTPQNSILVNAMRSGQPQSIQPLLGSASGPAVSAVAAANAATTSAASINSTKGKKGNQESFVLCPNCGNQSDDLKKCESCSPDKKKKSAARSKKTTAAENDFSNRIKKAGMPKQAAGSQAFISALATPAPMPPQPASSITASASSPVVSATAPAAGQTASAATVPQPFRVGAPNAASTPLAKKADSKTPKVGKPSSTAFDLNESLDPAGLDGQSKKSDKSKKGGLQRGGKGTTRSTGGRGSSKAPKPVPEVVTISDSDEDGDNAESSGRQSEEPSMESSPSQLNNEFAEDDEEEDPVGATGHPGPSLGTPFSTSFTASAQMFPSATPSPWRPASRVGRMQKEIMGVESLSTPNVIIKQNLKRKFDSPAPRPLTPLDAKKLRNEAGVVTGAPSVGGFVAALRGLNVTLDCQKVQIGSLKGTPFEPVTLSTEGVKILMECEHKTIQLQISLRDIYKCFIHSSKKLPVLFIFVAPTAVPEIQLACGMTSPKNGPYFDPSSEIEEFKRLVLLPQTISEDDRSKMETLFEALTKDRNGKKTSLSHIDLDVAKRILSASNSPSIKETMGVNNVGTINKSLAESERSTPDEELIQGKIFNEPIVKLTTYPQHPLTGGISITNEDVFCLNEGEFLNDVIIDFYLKFIFYEILSPTDRDRTFIFSSFFYKRLTQKPRKGLLEDNASQTLQQRRHSRVKTWTRQVDLFSKDFIIIPINESSHWYLAIICFPYLSKEEYWSQDEKNQLQIDYKERVLVQTQRIEKEKEKNRRKRQEELLELRRQNDRLSASKASNDGAGPESVAAPAAATTPALKSETNEVCPPSEAPSQGAAASEPSAPNSSAPISSLSVPNLPTSALAAAVPGPASVSAPCNVIAKSSSDPADGPVAVTPTTFASAPLTPVASAPSVLNPIPTLPTPAPTILAKALNVPAAPSDNQLPPPVATASILRPNPPQSSVVAAGVTVLSQTPVLSPGPLASTSAPALLSKAQQLSETSPSVLELPKGKFAQAMERHLAVVSTSSRAELSVEQIQSAVSPGVPVSNSLLDATIGSTSKSSLSSAAGSIVDSLESVSQVSHVSSGSSQDAVPPNTYNVSTTSVCTSSLLAPGSLCFSEPRLVAPTSDDGLQTIVSTSSGPNSSINHPLVSLTDSSSGSTLAYSYHFGEVKPSTKALLSESVHSATNGRVGESAKLSTLELPSSFLAPNSVASTQTLSLTSTETISDSTENPGEGADVGGDFGGAEVTLAPSGTMIVSTSVGEKAVEPEPAIFVGTSSVPSPGISSEVKRGRKPKDKKDSPKPLTSPTAEDTFPPKRIRGRPKRYIEDDGDPSYYKRTSVGKAENLRGAGDDDEDERPPTSPPLAEQRVEDGEAESAVGEEVPEEITEEEIITETFTEDFAPLAGFPVPQNSLHQPPTVIPTTQVDDEFRGLFPGSTNTVAIASTLPQNLNDQIQSPSVPQSALPQTNQSQMLQQQGPQQESPQPRPPQPEAPGAPAAKLAQGRFSSAYEQFLQSTPMGGEFGQETYDEEEEDEDMDMDDLDDEDSRFGFERGEEEEDEEERRRREFIAEQNPPKKFKALFQSHSAEFEAKGAATPGVTTPQASEDKNSAAGKVTDENPPNPDEEEDDEEEEDESRPLPATIPSTGFSIKRKPCILIFDSLGGGSRAKVVNILRDYLEVEYQAKKKNQPEIDFKACMKGNTPKVQQQDNFSDCGIYLLQYAESFFENPILDWTFPMKQQLKYWFRKKTVKAKRAAIRDTIFELSRKEKERNSVKP